MKKNELEYELDNILTVLLQIDSKERIFEFLYDLMSERQIIEICRRFEVAKMLYDDISYSRIEKKTWMSSTTIAKISKSLKSWNMGYINWLNILNL